MLELSFVRVRPDRPVELCASVEAFPDQGPDEGDRGVIDLQALKHRLTWRKRKKGGREWQEIIGQTPWRIFWVMQRKICGKCWSPKKSQTLVEHAWLARGRLTTSDNTAWQPWRSWSMNNCSLGSQQHFSVPMFRVRSASGHGGLHRGTCTHKRSPKTPVRHRFGVAKTEANLFFRTTYRCERSYLQCSDFWWRLHNNIVTATSCDRDTASIWWGVSDRACVSCYAHMIHLRQQAWIIQSLLWHSGEKKTARWRMPEVCGYEREWAIWRRNAEKRLIW